MRLARFALTLAVAGLLGASVASAQQAAGFGPRGAHQSRPAAYDYYADESPSDPAVPAAPDASQGPAAPEAPAGGEAASCDGAVDYSCCNFDGGCTNGCEEEEAWSLFGNCCWLKCHDIKVDGFVAQSFTWNPSNPVDRFNGPMTWTDRANEYQLNQAWLCVHKDAEADQCCWDIGYRVDACYGTDTRFIQGLGLDLTPGGVPQWNRDSRFYGIVTPQAYVEAKKDDWTIVAGRFISPTGYFTVKTNANFFPILPYTFQYGEPFTHTGIHATRKLNDNLSVMGGVCRGWDNVWDRDPRVLGMTMVTLTGDCKDSLTFWNMFGDEYAVTPVPYTFTAFRYIQTVVYQRPITDNVTWVLQSDFGAQSNSFGPGTATSYWYGVNTYAYYKYNDCWSWGVNAEWFRDDGGFRVGGFLIDRPGRGATPGDNLDGTGDRGLSAATRSGYNGSFYRFMVGPKWTPHKNVTFRSAAALDVYDGPRNAAGTLPFDGGAGRNQFVWANDVIFTY